MRLAGEIEEELGEALPPQQQPDRRHEDVADEGIHDPGEPGSQDDSDGQLERVPAQRKLFEFLEHASLLSGTLPPIYQGSAAPSSASSRRLVLSPPRPE